MDILNKLLDGLTGFLPTLSVPIKLGIIGGIAMVVLFFICFGLSYASNIEKYTKLLIAGSRKFSEIGVVTDENVGDVYDELQKHPEAVSTGWQVFLDQRVGMPSDYFPARNVLTAREYNGKRTLGKSLFVILGTIIWALIGLIGYYYFSSYSAEGIETGTAAAIILALEFLIIPVGMFIIFYLSLDMAYGRKLKRLGLAYTSFCETLDNCVVVTDKEEDAFVSDNLAEINKRVDELVAGRMDDEMIEVISVPKDVEPDGKDMPSVADVLRSMGIESAEEPEEEKVVKTVVEEQKEEPVKEEAVAELTPEEKAKQAFLENAWENEDFVRYALANEDLIHQWAKRARDEENRPQVDFTEMTEEEKYEWVDTVLQITQTAIDDKRTDPQDLEDLGALLEVALEHLEDPVCRRAITDYLGKLAARYYSIVDQQ